MKKRKRWHEIFQRIHTLDKIKMVEVGVWQGVNAFRLLGVLSQLEWWGVDTWLPPDCNSSYSKSGAEIAAKTAQEFHAAYEAAVAAVQPFEGRVHIVSGSSLNVVHNFENKSLDIVFIDADHSYEGCLADIIAWESKVKIGGWICGHDYANTKGDVKGAVDEMYGTDIELGDDHTWFHKIKEGICR
jgi:hypothetical protein